MVAVAEGSLGQGPVEAGSHLVALLLLLVDNVKLVVPEHHSLIVQVPADFVVLVLDWEGLASEVEVPGPVTDYESLVLKSAVAPDFASGVEVPGLELNGVLDLAFEEVSEAAWGLLVLVGLPATTVLGPVLVFEDPELDVLGYGLPLEGHASVQALAS